MECSIGTCAYGRVCVAGHGPMPARVLLIGEAPGQTELREGRPFIGRSGQLLDRLMGEVGLDRALIRITNRCGCVVMEREDRRPLPEEIAACAPRLAREVELTAPRVILLMGNTALSAYFPGYRIGEVYNQYRVIPGGVYIVPSYHPAAALRSPHLVPVVRDALRLAKVLSETEVPPSVALPA
jgi:uracil-DNA glycosylase family 4